MLRLALCALLGAGVGGCGKIKTVGSGGPDAAADDTDAGADDTPGEVTVEVFNLFDEADYGDPLADAPVLFFGPDGDLIEEATTDDDGVATGTVPPDSTVAIVATADGDDVTLAAFGVQPGDTITFLSPVVDSNDSGELLGKMTVETPVLDAGLGATTYTVYTGCGSQSSGTNVITDVSFYQGCTPGGEFDILVRAFDASGNVVETTSKHDTFANAGVSTIASWKGVDDLELAVTGIPAELFRTQLSLVPIKGGHGYDSVSTPFIEPDSDSFDASLAKLDTFGDKLAVTVTYQPTQTSLGPQNAFYVLEPDASDLPLPLDQELLPWIGQPAYSEPDRRWSWTKTGSGRAPDAQYVYFYGDRKSDGQQYGWIIVVPPGWTEVNLPDLPEEYDSHDFVDYSVIQGALILGIETNDYDGYDIRRVGVQPFFNFIAGPPPDADIGTTARISVGGSF